MPWLAIGAGASLLSGIGNFLSNSSANDRAAMLQNQAMQQWLKVNIPDPAQQKVALQRFVQQGQLDPVLQTAIQQDPSAFNKIVTDSTYKSAQNNALSQLEDIGNSGGMRLQDKADLQTALMQSQVQERAQRQGIEADMERRGMGASGFDVASQLQGQQTAANQLATNSLQTAANAQNRALQSIEDAGNMATQYQTNDFNQQAQKASAQDRINQFNTQNARDVNAANVGMQNYDQQQNLQNKQDIANRNTQVSNQEQMYNKSLAQQQFEDQSQVAAGMTGQYNNEAQTAQRGGQIAGNTISNIGSGISGAATSQANSDYWDSYFSRKKNDSSQGASS